MNIPNTISTDTLAQVLNKKLQNKKERAIEIMDELGAEHTEENFERAYRLIEERVRLGYLDSDYNYKDILDIAEDILNDLVKECIEDDEEVDEDESICISAHTSVGDIQIKLSFNKLAELLECFMKDKVIRVSEPVRDVIEKVIKHKRNLSDDDKTELLVLFSMEIGFNKYVFERYLKNGI